MMIVETAAGIATNSNAPSVLPVNVAGKTLSKVEQEVDSEIAALTRIGSNPNGPTLVNKPSETIINQAASTKVTSVTAPIDFDGHLLSAEIKPNGNIVGGHSTATGEVRVIPGTASAPNAQGVYSAKIEVADPANPGRYLQKTNGSPPGTSTMFPNTWTADRVKVEVDAAFANKTIVPGNTNMWQGVTPSGVKVEGYLNPKTTAYPLIR